MLRVALRIDTILRMSIWSCRWLLALFFEGLQIVKLVSKIVLFSPAALPAIAPIQYQELKAESIDLDGRLETNAQVVVVHLVELGARVQQTDMAGDGEEQVVVEGW